MRYDICWALYGYVFALKATVPFHSEDIAVELRRRKVRVTDSSRSFHG
jgi:hypothetical protein